MFYIVYLFYDVWSVVNALQKHTLGERYFAMDQHLKGSRKSPSTPPLELVKLINFAGGYCSVGPHCVEEHESNAEIVMMHTDALRARQLGIHHVNLDVRTMVSPTL